MRGHLALLVDLDTEEDGLYIANVSALPGAMAYGTTKNEAILLAQALALRVLSDRIAHRELDPLESITFQLC